jgi:protein SCO1/2
MKRDMDRTGKIALFCLTMLLLLVSGCDKPSAPAPSGTSTAGSMTNYTVNGIIVNLNPSQKKVTIRHEAITNYMEAMTMPFPVKDASLLTGFATNDTVRFQLTITETEGWISKLEKRVDTAGEANQTNKVIRPSLRVVREVEPLKVGDLLPPYPFTNEVGQAINLKDYKGQAVGITFMFTYCPFPDFCPRMSANFLSAMKLLKADKRGPTNWHLFSISFDTDRDSPEVLQRYAKRYNYDAEKWSFLTGALIEIDAITEQFGLSFPSEPSTQTFNHNLRTVIIDAKGRVHKIYIGNEWKPEEFAEEMKAAALVK